MIFQDFTFLTFNVFNPVVPFGIFPDFQFYLNIVITLRTSDVFIADVFYLHSHISFSESFRFPIIEKITTLNRKHFSTMSTFDNDGIFCRILMNLFEPFFCVQSILHGF